MLRFIQVIVCNLPRLYMIPKMAYKARHGEKYSEEECYKVCPACDTPYDEGRAYFHTEIWDRVSSGGGWLYDVSQPSGQV